MHWESGMPDAYAPCPWAAYQAVGPCRMFGTPAPDTAALHTVTVKAASSGRHLRWPTVGGLLRRRSYGGEGRPA